MKKLIFITISSFLIISAKFNNVKADCESDYNNCISNYQLWSSTYCPQQCADFANTPQYNTCFNDCINKNAPKDVNDCTVDQNNCKKASISTTSIKK
jgi:hypothetical protein